MKVFVSKHNNLIKTCILTIKCGNEGISARVILIPEPLFLIPYSIAIVLVSK